MSFTLGFRSIASHTRPWQKSEVTQKKILAMLHRAAYKSPSPSQTAVYASRQPLQKNLPHSYTNSITASAEATRFIAFSPRAMFSTSRSASSNNTKLEKSSNKRPESRSCWKCAQSIPYLAMQCPQCKAVQPVAPGANYFETLGLPPEPNFDIDVKDLRIKFFKIQQLIHPDSYSQNTNGDQAYAQQQSTFANKAYACLKDPLPRANYILELKGAGVHEAESLENPELLMEVMEARELLEEAETEDEVNQLKSQNDARIEETTKGLSKAFKEDDIATAKTLAIQLQYWIRIQNVIRDWAAGKPIVADHV
ncbi:hypothetical protein BGW42_006733 [Actinomortierella wolfii]|nr:hypothetical protein BGW42_006733 [Actinomortierella wolfii]